MPYSRRPLFPSCDTRCPDGFACYGWRQVHKSGFVRWYGHRYYHDDLKLLEGLWVYVTIGDWLAVELEIYTTDAFVGDTIIAHMEGDEVRRLRLKLKESKSCTK